MIRPSLEVADVLRMYSADYLDSFGANTSAEQRRVLRDLVRCRTAELGGHVEECDQCGHRQIAYNSCRNRHCPKCQATARAQWLDERAAELLPVEYFHVVFTLPAPLGPLALHNPRVVYGTLFRAAADSLLEIARDPKHLGADIGFLMVLHTWGQNLHLHPHVHCVVPGGGLAPDGTRWISCRPGFFLPVRVLSRLFRGKFLAYLNGAFDRGRLGFFGSQESLGDPCAFHRLIDDLRQEEWVVYAKPPWGGPEAVLKYLARYTYRVAISNHRLIKVEDDKVHFSWKDYAHGNKTKVMSLEAIEFIRRFLQHVLPPGFMRIRHFGLLANCHRDEKLQQCRELLASSPAATAPSIERPEHDAKTESPRFDRLLCPVCQQGHMLIVEAVKPERPRPGTVGFLPAAVLCDTS